MAKFNTIMYGSLEDLDSILDRETMDEQELRASIQRVLSEVRYINQRLEKLELRTRGVEPDLR